MADSTLPSIDDFEDAEHCVLEDVTVLQPALIPADARESSEAREIRDVVAIRDKLRGRRTVVRIYAEGWIDLEIERRGKPNSHHRIDLSYLDPVPTMRRHQPIRLLRTAGFLGGLTSVCAIPAVIGWLSSITIPATIVGAVATLVAVLVAFYRSNEEIRFKTLHGRADAIRFYAGLGTIRQFRKLVPKLVDVIADAAESVHDETEIYLRAEMREHYRLKRDGILSDAESRFVER